MSSVDYLPSMLHTANASNWYIRAWTNSIGSKWNWFWFHVLILNVSFPSVIDSMTYFVLSKLVIHCRCFLTLIHFFLLFFIATFIYFILFACSFVPLVLLVFMSILSWIVHWHPKSVTLKSETDDERKFITCCIWQRSLLALPW